MRSSLKKSVLAVVVCSGIASIAPAVAGAGSPTGSSATSLTMHVVGTITNSTCNIRPYTTAGADATTLNLGVMTKEALASEVNFYLKPENGCSAGIIATTTPTNPGSTTAQITWESSGLTEHGISNMYGTAKNVHMELSPVSESGVAEIDTGASSVVSKGLIKTGSQTVTYNKITDSSTVLPFKYSVKLVKDGAENVTVGTFDTDITYTVAYI
ncbi:TPA: hypothetical protein ACIPFX_001073 [Salmonella enterica subsp. enterica serovar Birkenhead]|jgi:type 1 fimbria pilin